MSNASVEYTFEGKVVKIQCSRDDKMKDICEKYSNKIGRNVNSLVFLYGGSHLNFELSFKAQANIIDKERNEMSVLVYKNEDELSCPKCGEKINLNSEKINDIKTSINNISDMLKGVKFTIENIIKISSEEAVKFQLKNVYFLFNNLNENLTNLNKKFDDLLNVTNINKELNLDTNYIIAEINIKDADINKDIKILSSYEECIRNNPERYFKNDNYKNENEIKQCEIRINDEIIPFNYYHKFKSKGKYIIKYSFKTNLKSTCLLFRECELITKINLSNFNTNSVSIMKSMFSGCSSLTNIDLTNINTNNVTNMWGMFDCCSSLTNIDLSNFNTNKVTDMRCLFFGCSKLRKENVITNDKRILNQLY